MNKKVLLIMIIFSFCIQIFCQNLQFQNDVNPADQQSLFDGVNKIAYILINLGLAIGAIPTVKRLFMGEPGAWKAALAWGGALLTANMAIALVSSYVAGQAAH